MAHEKAILDFQRVRGLRIRASALRPSANPYRARGGEVKKQKLAFKFGVGGVLDPLNPKP